MLVLFMRFETLSVSKAWEAGMRLATRDDVTDLPSAPFADHFVAMEFAAAERGREVTIVLLGFDDFDEFTRRHGSAAADRAIRRFSQTLKKLTRRMNLTARYGWRADTFLSVLSDADAAGAEVFVQRVRDALSEEAGSAPLPGVSAGVVEFDPSFRTPEEFVQQAERVLLDARAEGGNETVVRRSLIRRHSETGWLQAL
jgi:diguanylate cyclase (GGDEF)-like protein